MTRHRQLRLDYELYYEQKYLGCLAYLLQFFDTTFAMNGCSFNNVFKVLCFP